MYVQLRDVDGNNRTVPDALGVHIVLDRSAFGVKNVEVYGTPVLVRTGLYYGACAGNARAALCTAAFDLL